MNTQLKAQQQLKVNDCLSIKKAGQCIKYETVINTPKSKEHLMISHDEVDRYNFAKGFMEVIGLKVKNMCTYILILIL